MADHSTVRGASTAPEAADSVGGLPESGASNAMSGGRPRRCLSRWLAPLRGANAAVLAVAVLFVLLLASLTVMGDVAQNSDQFEQWFVWLVAFHAVVLVPLTLVILWQLIRLGGQYRVRAPGSQLTLRLVASFVLIAVIPAAIVYTFSYRFLTQGVDSWFDVRVEAALSDALELSRSSLDLQVRQLARDTQDIVDELENLPESVVPVVLNELRSQMNALELTLIGANNRIVFSSTDASVRRLPTPPSQDILWRIEPGRPFTRIEPVGDPADLQSVTRVVALSANAPPEVEPRLLQAVYPVDRRMSALALRVEDAFGGYREFAYLRGVIKQGFILTMSLAFVIAVMAALWAGLLVARRLTTPVADLAEGTRRIADGQYNALLPVRRQDELGFLVQSFNRMTRNLRETRADAERARRMLESERMYLDTVLQNLRSGVMALDARLVIRTANAAASAILGVVPARLRRTSIDELARVEPAIAAFREALVDALAAPRDEWSREVSIPVAGQRRELVVRGAWLAEPVGQQGLHVLVFDDMTDYLRAQRESAWGEVARRLAHEIKNPLTPIRLSADRLARQLGPVVQGREHEILERATRTIVQQVDAMKTLVNAFRDYAQPPTLAMTTGDLNRLTRDVADLYASDDRRQIECQLEPGLPLLEFDAGRLRQLLHNLIKNGFEAASQHRDPAGLSPQLADASVERAERPTVWVTTRRDCRGAREGVVLEVVDNGPGIDPTQCRHIFEPYVTNKPRGTGLGLAVARKIAEEHGGMIECDNVSGRGARFCVWMPATVAGDA